MKQTNEARKAMIVDSSGGSNIPSTVATLLLRVPEEMWNQL